MPYIGFNTENDAARTAIRELLGQHDPIRVVGGNWRSRPVTFDYRTIDGVDGNELAWTATHRSAAGNPSDEDIKERGITLIVRAAPYGCDGYDRWVVVNNTEHGQYENGFTWMAPPEGHQLPTDYGLPITAAELRTQYESDHGEELVFYSDPGITLAGAVGPGVIQLFLEPQLALTGPCEQAGTLKMWTSLLTLALNRYHTDTADWAEAQVARVRAAFVENLSMNPTTEIATLRGNLASTEAAIEEQQSRMERAQQRLEQHRGSALGIAVQIDSILAQAETMADPETLALAYDRIMENDDIESITMDRSNIVILTNEINITRIDTGDSVPLGKMRILLTGNGQQVHITNLTNARGGRQHPHITGNQQICWGNLQATWSALCKVNDIQAKIALIMRYLKSCNPVDDWGRYAAYWFGDPESRGDLILGFTPHVEEEGVAV